MRNSLRLTCGLAVLAWSVTLTAGLWGLTPQARQGKEPTKVRSKLSDWEWFVEIPLPAKDKSELYDFLVPPAVLDQSQGEGEAGDLGDLRLVDGRGREIPFALRVRRPVDVRQPLGGVKFNASINAQQQTTVSLDLGINARHNSIKVLTSGQNFRRKAMVEGSDDKTHWAPILGPVDLLSFQTDKQSLVQNTFGYSENRHRYVRVTVSPDPANSDDRPQLNDVIVQQSVQAPGLDVRYRVEIGSRETVTTEQGPVGVPPLGGSAAAEPPKGGTPTASAWLLTFAGYQVPIDRLTLDAKESEFSRPYRLELVTGDNTFQVLEHGQWQRGLRDSTGPLELRWKGDVWASKLRLVVVDSSNPPLTLTGVQAFGPARQVIFPAGDWEGPLKLYLGKPGAEIPRYDFAEGLPVPLKTEPVRIESGSGEGPEEPGIQTACPGRGSNLSRKPQGLEVVRGGHPAATGEEQSVCFPGAA